MASYTFDYVTFINAFPEFSSISQSVVEAQAELLLCETNCYEGIASCRADAQECAIWLHLAHNLKLREKEIDPCANAPLTEVKSKNDAEKYMISDDLGGYGWNATVYGKRLQDLLKSCDALISTQGTDCSFCFFVY